MVVDFDGAVAVAASPDGRNVYVTSRVSDAVAVLSRTRRRLAGLVATLVAAGGLPSASAPTQCGRRYCRSRRGRRGLDDDGLAVGDTKSVPQLMVENLTTSRSSPTRTTSTSWCCSTSPSPPTPMHRAPRPRHRRVQHGEAAGAQGRQVQRGARPRRGLDGPAGRAGEVRRRGGRPVPRQEYGFTFFDHGGGNTGGFVDTGPPGTQELSVPEMREGLLMGMQQAGIDRFDVIDQAACLMANYETASALAPLAKWIAGSEEIMISHPLAPASFPAMGQGGNGQDVAGAFVNGYVDLLDSIALQPGGQAYRDLVAMSVVDGDAVANLDAALVSFSQTAVAHMPEITTAVARARARGAGVRGRLPRSGGRVARPRRPRRLHEAPHRSPGRRRRGPGRGVRGRRPCGHRCRRPARARSRRPASTSTCRRTRGT